MNQSNIRFLSFASVSLLAALVPLACGGDDDTTSNNTAGSTSHGGSAGKGGTTSGGKSGGVGGSNTVAGEAALGGNSAAGEDVGGAGGAGGAVTVPTARLRIVHASPSAPSVDIYAKGSATVVAKGVAYGTATDFTVLDAGTVAFDLRAAGAKATTAPAFTTDDIELVGGADYTLVAAGDFAQLADPDVGFRVLALEHDFEAPAAGMASARVVHAATAWDDVDFDLNATDGVDVPALARFTDQSNLALPAGAALAVDFQTDVAGVLSRLTVPKLTAGSELFVIATGNPGFPFRAPANGFALLVVDQDGKVSWVREQPWLHLLHASDIGSVDVYETTHTAAAAKLADNLTVQTIANFQLPASATGFDLKAVAADAVSGTSTGLASGSTSTVEAGEHYLAYVAGSGIQTIHEQFDLEQPSKVMLRGVHASATIAQTVDFGAVVSDALSSALVSGVMPQESSAEAGVAINPGNIILGASPHGVTTLLAQKTLTGTTAPVAGERDFVLLTGTDGIWAVNTSVAGWTLR